MAEAGLRVVVALGEGLLRGWQRDCIQALMQVPRVEVAAIQELPHGQAGKTGGRYRRWLNGRTSDQLRSLPPTEMPGGLRRLAGLGRDAQELFQGGTIDLMLQLGGDPPALPPGTKLRHGLWRFRWGGGHSPDPVPGIVQSLRGEPHIDVLLERTLPGRDETFALRCGCFPLGDAEATASTILSCCAMWPGQVCHAILAGDPEAGTGSPVEPCRQPCSTPGDLAMIRMRLRQYLGLKQGSEAPAEPQEWNIGILPNPIGSLLAADPSRNVRWLPAPATGSSRGRPFGWVEDDQLNVLYEKAGRRHKHPVIARLRPKRDNNLKRSRTVLEADGSLSYPCLVEHEGHRFVVPEQCASGRLDLYEVNEDATDLVHRHTLLDLPLHSPTLFAYQGRWWLMGTDPRLPDAMLRAFHADRPEGPYEPHLMDPLKTDLRSSRPGGTPFLEGGALWRPVQDLSRPVPRIRICRVVELTPRLFREEVGDLLEPMHGQWSHGIRTVSQVGRVTLVDGLQKPAGRSRKFGIGSSSKA